MTSASDSMEKAFDSMAGVFYGCGSWMTALSDLVAGGHRLVTGLAHDFVGRNPNMARFPDPSGNGRVGHPAFPTLPKL